MTSNRSKLILCEAHLLSDEVVGQLLSGQVDHHLVDELHQLAAEGLLPPVGRKVLDHPVKKVPGKRA